MNQDQIELNKPIGLELKDVLLLRKKYGFNEISSKKEKNIFERLLSVLAEPMIFLLLSIGVIYLLLGDTGEAILLSCSVILIIIITMYQEGKTESALSALKTLASPRTNVWRDGILRKVDGREILPGDVIIVNEGDRIPADSMIVSTDHLKMDESLLTGESVAVIKNIGDEIFCGSLVVAGQATCEVKLIGNQTQIGKIGKTISEEQINKTLLEKEVAKIVRFIFIFAILLCTILAIYLGFKKGNWLGGILSGLTLAIGILPEELPLVLTIFFAFGAYRLSKKKVLTRRTSIIETLGAATVLCTDKTGTITQNKMTIKCLYAKEGEIFYLTNDIDKKIPAEFSNIVKYGTLASKSNAFDPIDKAFLDLGKKENLDFESNAVPDKFVKEFPISSAMLAMTQVWKQNGEYLVASKGAPEAIIKICKLEPNIERIYLEKVKFLASKGYRMLAVCRSSKNLNFIPDSLDQIDFEWVGLVGLEDPIREEVPSAIQRAYSAGMRVIMITGDYPETAKNIAKQIGLKISDHVMTGPELKILNDNDYKESVNQCNIFSRVSPEEKWKLVRLLKEQGEIVAMTGDGVNDAPALRTAHIGVAMGERGTDVAREAADLVLLDDSFSSLLNGVEEGRHIYSNLKKALGYIIAVHIPIIGSTFFPTIFDLPYVILSAVHIVFLEMIIDPTSTLVFEKEPIESGLMSKPPRKVSESLLDKKLFIISVLQGISSLIAVIGTYVYIQFYVENASLNPRLGTTSAFVTLIFTNLLLILVNRNWELTIIESLKMKNMALPFVILGTFTVLFSALFIPSLQKLFHFTSLSLGEISICFLFSLASIVWFEIAKIIIRSKVSYIQTSS
ncbi:MAG: cation-translocating P-type ATPase [Leptospira sp.]|nr:cation-translocating P-type ATPase [Leptospira sp.]